MDASTNPARGLLASPRHGQRGGRRRSRAASLGGIGLLLAFTLALAGGAQAAQPPVGLGTAESFAVLGGSAVTNTGPSVIHGDLGVSPGTSVTGFPPGTAGGTIHAANAVARQAQSDLTTAYTTPLDEPLLSTCPSATSAG